MESVELGTFGQIIIYLSIALVVIALAVSLIGPIINLLTNFEESKKALMGIVGVAVLLLIGYALAGGGELPKYAVDAGISPAGFRRIGAVINTAIIATGIMVVYLIFDLFMGVLRN